MDTFHVNNNGDAGPCRAKNGGCPFGGEEAHHATPEEARAAYEAQMGGSFGGATKAHEFAERLLSEWKHEYAEAQAEWEKSEDGDGYTFGENLSWEHPSHHTREGFGASHYLRERSNGVVGIPAAEAEEELEATARALEEFYEWEAKQY